MAIGLGLAIVFVVGLILGNDIQRAKIKAWIKEHTNKKEEKKDNST